MARMKGKGRRTRAQAPKLLPPPPPADLMTQLPPAEELKKYPRDELEDSLRHGFATPAEEREVMAHERAVDPLTGGKRYPASQCFICGILQETPEEAADDEAAAMRRFLAGEEEAGARPITRATTEVNPGHRRGSWHGQVPSHGICPECDALIQARVRREGVPVAQIHNDAVFAFLRHAERRKGQHFTNEQALYDVLAEDEEPPA